MIISRTPFRVSFFGGGTDFPDHFKRNGGAVLSTTIDKYCYITLRRLPPFFEHKHRVVYSLIENANHIAEIKHPAVKAIYGRYRIEEGLELHHDGDLPARSGLGSSSSFSVGLINAIEALNGRRVSKKFLAQEAIKIEQTVMGENVGCQDQIAVAHGGFNQINFLKDGDFDVNPLICDQEKINRLENHLMLFFTGVSRWSSEIQVAQIENMHKSADILGEMHQQVDIANDILTSSNRSIEEFGELLDRAWNLKKQLSNSISTDLIDSIYNSAMQAGAIGGKILGAGGGGFMLFFVRPDQKKKVKEALKNLIHVPFKFEKVGSQIIYYNG